MRNAYTHTHMHTPVIHLVFQLAVVAITIINFIPAIFCGSLAEAEIMSIFPGLRDQMFQVKLSIVLLFGFEVLRIPRDTVTALT